MSLPFDVLEQVVSHLSDSGQTLLALCHVSRDTYSLARPALYRFVELGPRSVFRTFLDNIAREPSLGRHVISFVMQSELENNDLSLVIRVLGTMVNLRHLDVRCLDSVIRQDVGVLDVIKGLSHLRSITVSTGRSSSYVRVFTRLPAMRAVNVDGNLGYYQVKVFDELLLRSVTSLERLRIMGYYNFSDLLKGHSDLRWESVRDLEIRLIPESMEPTSLQVAHAFPSVERLDLTLSAAPATRLMSDPTLFPHVRDMTVRVERERVPRPAAHLVPGRRTVEHLTMHLSDAAPSLKLFADVFQWQALRSLQLHAGWIFDETIAVLNLCSSLYYLSLTVQSTALGFRRGARDAMDVAAPRLVSKLNQLRHIAISPLLDDDETARGVEGVFNASPPLQTVRVLTIDTGVPMEWRRRPDQEVFRVAPHDVSLRRSSEDVVDMVDRETCRLG